MADLRLGPHPRDSRRGQLEYRYDPVGRLLAATGALGHEVFAFDPASNIVSPEKRGTKLLDNLLKDYAGTHYEYDERGNLIKRTHNGEVSSFDWDAFNRMVKATTPQGVTNFAYDPLGRRIEKHSPKAKTLYGWDGDVLAFESSERRSVHYVHEAGSFVPLAQATRQGPIALTASVGAKELMGADGRYDIDRDPLWNGQAEDPAGPGFTKEEIAYYQCDHLGTPQELTDHEGNIAWAAQYMAWGQAKEVISEAARKAGIANPIRFQGQYLDEETGLHYNRYRYYDPHSGRFVSKDPIGLFGGLNVFQFAPNPAGWIDPLGLKKKCPCLDAAECKALLDKINKKALGRKATDGSRGLLERIEHLKEDHAGLYDFAYDTPATKGPAADKGTYKGHIAAAEDLKRGLNRDIGEYHKGGCKGFAKISGEVLEVAALPVPQKPNGR